MTAPRLTGFTIRNYRSIGSDSVKITMPFGQPLVLIGENNAGKSNITRAIDLLFSERWASTHTPDDHEFFGRDRRLVNIQLVAEVENLPCGYCGGPVRKLSWTYDDQREGDPQEYRQSCGVCSKTFVQRDTKFRMMSIVVAADRNLTYQLSYSSRYTLLSKLMRRFHQKLTGDDSRREVLEGIFKALVEQFRGVEEFSDFQDLLSATTELLGQNLPYALEIDFSAYDPSNFFRSLRVHPQLLGEVRSFDELGTGQLQVLAIAFAYAYAKAFGGSEALVLIIDEPESNLHPLAQQWLARQLRSLVTDGLQIIITTHSPHFVDLAQQQSIVLVRRDAADTHTLIRQRSREQFVAKLIELGAPAERTTAASVEEFYAAAATVEVVSGLFARKCILVEGKTEAFALPELLRLVGFEPLIEGIAFVSADGISNIAKWSRLYSTYGIPSYAVFDTDSNKSPSERKQSETAQEDIQRALLQDGAKFFPMRSDPIRIERSYATLDPQFEGSMRGLLGSRWSELEADGRAIVGGSRAGKPLVARYIAKRLNTADLPPQAKLRLTELASKIQALVP